MKRSENVILKEKLVKEIKETLSKIKGCNDTTKLQINLKRLRNELKKVEALLRIPSKKVILKKKPVEKAEVVKETVEVKESPKKSTKKAGK